MPQHDCSEKLRLLANATRMEVLERLLADDPLHVWEINEGLDVEPTLLSHHLRVLREAGLIEAERDGKALLYRLAPGVRPAKGKGIDLECCVLNFPEER